MSLVVGVNLGGFCVKGGKVARGSSGNCLCTLADSGIICCIGRTFLSTVLYAPKTRYTHVRLLSCMLELTGGPLGNLLRGLRGD